jgi:hypothetical protein
MPKFRYIPVFIVMLLLASFAAAQDEASSFAAYLAEKRIAFSLTFAEKSLEDYRVAVLGRDGLADLRLPETVVLDEADALRDWLSESTPDAVLILPDALDWLKPADLHSAYREGMAIVTHNLSFAQHAALTGDACTLPSVETDAQHPLIATVWVLMNGDVLDEAQREVVLEAGLVSCDVAKTERLTEQPWGVHTGYQVVPAAQAKDLTTLTGALLTEFAASRAYHTGGFALQQTALAEWRAGGE